MRVFFLTLLFLTARVALAEPTVSTENLAQELGTRMTRVPEFEFIRKEAERLGIRVYLFGGTAAAYSHYIREDLLREAGDTRFPAPRFDYDYTNIFRSTQDLDIVVDGSAEQAEKLETLLKGKFSHFLGEKTNWEVRPLRVARGEKEAILGNSDFANQHTDSHSTGMVEVTKAPKNELPVKDVRDWESKEPQFLKDVVDRRLHYYFSPLHKTTNRAQKGLNPPILSAIRYLTKAFQYDLEVGPEDLELIRKIIADFDPASLKNDYLKRWVEKNGKKLFQNSVDLEYAAKVLDEVGLRKKLIAIKNNLGDTESLAWWMSKEPLKSKVVGKGRGKTAAEIFGDNLTFSHETNTLLAYESISRSKAGELNALVSRSDKKDEAAILGEGFYAKNGRKGARNTGLTIRIRLNPNARLGTDFTREGDVIVLKNKAAATVLHEQIDLSLVEYFRKLNQGEKFSPDDRALIEIFHRRAGRDFKVSAEDRKELEAMLKEQLSHGDNPSFFAEWFALPLSKNYPEIPKQLAELSLPQIDIMLAKNYLANPNWPADIEVFRAIQKRGYATVDLLTEALPLPQWKEHAGIVEEYFPLVDARKMEPAFVIDALASPNYHDRPDILRRYVGLENNNLDDLVWKVLTHQNWQKYPDIVLAIAQKGGAGQRIMNYLMSDPFWSNQPEIIRAIASHPKGALELASNLQDKPHLQIPPDVMDRITADKEAAKALFFSDPKRLSDEKLLKVARTDPTSVATSLAKLEPEVFRRNPELLELAMTAKHWDSEIAGIIAPAEGERFAKMLEKLIDRGDERSLGTIVTKVLTQKQWGAYPDLLMKILMKGKVAERVVRELLPLTHWAGEVKWVDKIARAGSADDAILEVLPSAPHWPAEEIMSILLRRGKASPEAFALALSSPLAKQHPEWIEEAMKQERLHGVLATQVLPHWPEKPQWMKKILSRGTADVALARDFLPANPDRVDLALDIIGRGNPTAVTTLMAETLKNPGWEKHPEVVMELIRRDQVNMLMVDLLKEPGWQQAEILRAILESPAGQAKWLPHDIADLLANPAWAEYPEFLVHLARQSEFLEKVEALLKKRHWKQNAHLKKLLGGKDLTLANLRAIAPDNPTCPGQFAAFRSLPENK